MQNPTCPVCGSAIPPKAASGPRRRYCTKKCRSRAEYLRQRPKIVARQAELSRKRLASSSKPCKQCGTVFTPERSRRQLYCSPPCRRRAGRNSLTRSCTTPGCNRPHRARGLCSMHWKRQARAEGRVKNQAWDERRRDAWKVRQSIKRGAREAELFSYQEIFERDGWVCGICDLTVDPTLDYPHPLSRSLDHILPLSRGGTHTRANVQLAHLQCNVRKGDRVPGDPDPDPDPTHDLGGREQLWRTTPATATATVPASSEPAS